VQFCTCEESELSGLELLELEAGSELLELEAGLELLELDGLLDELLEDNFEELELDDVTDELLNFELVVVPASQAIILNANSNARIEIINSLILLFKTKYLLILRLLYYIDKQISIPFLKKFLKKIIFLIYKIVKHYKKYDNIRHF